nr:hypothetical protein [uncultured Oscillibacter sp.]
MKKVFPLFLLFIFLLTSTVNAQTERLSGDSIKLTFEGTTACCNVTIASTDLKGDISATIKLMDGSTCINSWRKVASGYLFFADSTTSVKKGKSYTLTVTYSIDGVTQPSLSTSATCK